MILIGGTVNLSTIAFVDCEASGLGPDSYPIEIGWCLADSGMTGSGSCLIVPAPSWTSWDPEAERVHQISRYVLQAGGVSVSRAADALSKATHGRALFADSSHDSGWVGRLFDAAGRQPPIVNSFDRLLDAVVRPDPGSKVDPLMRELTRADLQGKLIDAAYAYADWCAPKTHRAARDAYYLFETFQRALMIGAFSADDLLADVMVLREMGFDHGYKLDHPDAVVCESLETPLRIWDGKRDIQIVFAEMPPVVVLRRDHFAFSEIYALLVHSMTTERPLVAAIDQRSWQLVSVRWPALAELAGEGPCSPLWAATRPGDPACEV
jgi:hypothetical protein